MGELGSGPFCCDPSDVHPLCLGRSKNAYFFVSRWCSAPMGRSSMHVCRLTFLDAGSSRLSQSWIFVVFQRIQMILFGGFSSLAQNGCLSISNSHKSTHGTPLRSMISSDCTARALQAVAWRVI